MQSSEVLLQMDGNATIRPSGICGGKCKMRHRGKPFLAGDVVQFRLKKDGSENLFARMVEMASQPSVGSPTRSAFLQGSNLSHAAQTRVIGVSRLN
jgi:hypothetical protein